MPTAIHELDVAAIRSLLPNFDLCAIADVDTISQSSTVQNWVGAGLHGSMGYMSRTAGLRDNLRSYLPWAKSLIIACKNYHCRQTSDGFTISKYALWRDYHQSLEAELKPLCDVLAGRGYKYKILIDAQPVSERTLAKLAGVGWVGKNTMLINERLGSYFFISAIATDAQLPAASRTQNDRCGTCSKCIDLCPTNAIIAPYTLDSKRCIAYLTIEYKGIIPRELRGLMGDLIFGCDICQDVCPWNRHAKDSTETKEFLRSATRLTLAEYSELSDDEFRRLFAGSPIIRAKRDGFIRNVVIAMANSGSVDYLPQLRKLSNDKSEIVRAHAAWALGVIASSHAERSEEVRRWLCELLERESSPCARAEIETALSELP